MTTAEYFCSVSPSGPFFSIKNPVGVNISLDDSIMQAGGARHEYRSPLLPSPNPFKDAELFSGEEIVLGVLSLFIISLISSLVYDVLLRSGYNMAYSTRAISIAAALESVERWGFQFMPFVGARGNAEQDEAPRPKLWFKGIFFVFFLAAATFSMEVALIVATQEVDVTTNGEEIGFTVTSPVVTHWGMGQFLRRNAPTRPCVTPSISGGNIEWKARVQTCLNANFSDSVPRNVPYSGRVRYRSVYHRRGCDHFLSALEGGPTYVMSVRVKIYRSDAGPAEVLRSPIEQEEDTALLVHLTAPIYYATNLIRNESKTCNETQIPPITYTHKVTKEKVTVGQTETGLLVEDGNVYSTEFDIDVDDIEWWIVQGLGSAAASAGISLTDSPQYLIGRTGELTTINDEMYVTKRRRFAAPTMCVVLAVLLIFKLLVKKFLKPLSLFEIARIKALEAAGIDPYSGMRDEHGSIRIDMDRNNQSLSALYSGPAHDTTQRNELTYEEAQNYYVHTAKQ